MKNTVTAKNKKSIRPALIFGLITGMVNGFFGSGGGMIAVETMEYLGTDSKQAHASSILAILPLSTASALIYFLKGSLIFSSAHIALLGGACAGGVLGALLLGKISAKWLDWLFTFLMLLSGFRMVFL